MRARSILSILVVGAMLVPGSGAHASDGGYQCRASEPVGAATPVAGLGPSCSFIVSCPTTAIQCSFFANAIASGVGTAGVYVEVFGTSGATCSGPVSCQTANVVKTLTRGSEVSVTASWSSGTVPSVAGIANILLQAKRTDV